MNIKTVAVALALLIAIAALLIWQQTRKATQPGDPDPVAHFTFDSEGSLGDDSSKNARHGLLSGNPSAAQGKVGSGALSFDGIDDLLSAPNALTATDNWTISLWTNPSVVPQMAGGAMVMIGDDSGGYGIGLGSGSASARLFGLFGNAAWIDSGRDLVAGEWQHVVMKREDGTTSFYINGAQAPKTGIRAPLTPHSVLSIGSNFAARHSPIVYQRFSGLIDDVRVYNRALTSVEIAELYALGGGVVSGSSGAPTKQ